MEVPRLGVESELQLQAYTTVTATQDPGIRDTSETYTIAHSNAGSIASEPGLQPTPQLRAMLNP